MAAAGATQFKVITPVDFHRDPFLKNAQSPFPIIRKVQEWRRPDNAILEPFPNNFGKEQEYGRKFPNTPPITLRSQSDSKAPDQFYRHAFSRKKNIAVIVPYEKLGELRRVLPDLQIDKYETVDDFWSYDSRNTMTARKQYKTIVDLCNDEGLWKVEAPVTIGKASIVDCIIYAQQFSEEFFITRELAAHMWVGSEGTAGFWSSPGTRGTIKLKNPKVLICDFPPISYRFPIFEKSEMPFLRAKAEYALTVFEYLQSTCKGCGWFEGTPEVAILACPDDGSPRNVLVDPGTEHLHILPLEEDKLIEWLDDGSVENGRVTVIDTKGNKYAKFKPPYRSVRLWNDPESFKAFFDTEKKTEVVVMYCNHASSSSPSVAEAYFKWLRQEHPESRQQVTILREGMGGLLNRLRKLRRSDEFLIPYGGC